MTSFMDDLLIKLIFMNQDILTFVSFVPLYFLAFSFICLSGLLFSKAFEGQPTVGMGNAFGRTRKQKIESGAKFDLY